VGAERGSFSIELAIVSPSVILLIALVLGAGTLGAEQVEARSLALMAVETLARGAPASGLESTLASRGFQLDSHGRDDAEECVAVRGVARVASVARRLLLDALPPVVARACTAAPAPAGP
jgi:hypothetical protein